MVTSMTEAVSVLGLQRTTAWIYDTNFPGLAAERTVASTSGVGTRQTNWSYDPTSADLLTVTLQGTEAGAPPFFYPTTYTPTLAGPPQYVDPPGFSTTDRTEYTYDASRGGLVASSRIDPIGLGTTIYDYDPFNRRTSTTDPNGLATLTAYDALNRVTSSRRHHTATPADELITTSLYSVFGDLACTVLPRGNAVEERYDSQGRLIQVLRGTAAPSPTATTCLNASLPRDRDRYELDAFGHRVHEYHESSPGGEAWVLGADTSYTYANRCQLRKVTRAPLSAEEASTEYAFDCAGNLQKVWDANHDSANQTAPATQVYGYDALNRLSSLTEPWTPPGGPNGTAVTSYLYDVQDHLRRVTDANGNETNYVTSDRDLLTQESSPVSGVANHSYNSHGLRQQTADPRGTVVRTLDEADRLRAVTYADHALDAQMSYGTSAAAFELGRLVGLRRHGRTITYAYDKFGRQTQDGSLAYGYDANGNRSVLTYPGGAATTTTFDFADRPSTQSLTAGGGPLTVVSGASYAPAGPLTGLSLGNGRIETRLFDHRYLPTDVEVSGAPKPFDWQYTTDDVGNILAIDDQTVANEDRTFGYQDVQYFLTQGDGPWGLRGWRYDKIGDRTKEFRDGDPNDGDDDVYAYVGTTPTLASITLAGGAGGTRTYGHDGAGDVTSVSVPANQVLLSWDADGHLATIDRPAGGTNAQVDLRYDPRGFLLGLRGDLYDDDFESGTETCWSTAFESGTASATSCAQPANGPTYASSGRLMSQSGKHVIYFGSRPVAQYEAATSTITYLTSDHLGTPVLATTAAGATVWDGGFEPFGADWSGAQAAGVALRLPGQWEQQDASFVDATQGLGIYYNVHRWYEWRAGNYLSPDPDWLEAQTAPDGTHFGIYLYANATPTGRVDPLGLLSFQLGRSCERLQPEQLERLRGAIEDASTNLAQVSACGKLVASDSAIVVRCGSTCGNACARYKPRILFARASICMSDLSFGGTNESGGTCGQGPTCLASTLFHEMVHACGGDHPSRVGGTNPYTCEQRFYPQCLQRFPDDAKDGECPCTTD